MKISKDEKVQNFLDNLKISNVDVFEMMIEMRKITFDTYPDVCERMMYGGIMFSISTEDFGGLFVRKNHISYEFSIGFKMKDPNNRLEGKGKYRRHLKIRKREDILNKEVTFFVKQAI